MTNDDDRVGQILSRREALTLLGVSGFMLITGRQRAMGQMAFAPGTVRACVVRPEQTEGPYFVDEMLNRADIRRDPTDGIEKPGAPLDLTFNVSRVVSGKCTPLAGAHVDVWQCDHLGVYSDVTDPEFATKGKKFLRGYQVTDSQGVARFTTVYPGWYRGRAVHIHFKIRSAPAARPGYEFTSQLYFDDAFTDQVHAHAPYAGRGEGRVRNERDGIFRRENGRDLILEVAKKGNGYAGTFDVAVA